MTVASATGLSFTQRRCAHRPFTRSAIRWPGASGSPQMHLGGLCWLPPGSEHAVHTHRLPLRTTA